jgi:hypothetical protein
MRGKQFFEGKTIKDWAIACFTPQQSVKPMVSTEQLSCQECLQDHSVADQNFFRPGSASKNLSILT